MSTSSILVLVTHAPTHPLAKHALRYVSHAVQAGEDMHLFFYAEGARVANALLWQPADQMNLTHEWQKLADTYNLDLKVCVSTALARGITDEENAQRHGLVANNLQLSSLASGFSLVGLTDLMLMMDSADVVKVIQF